LYGDTKLPEQKTVVRYGFTYYKPAKKTDKDAFEIDGEYYVSVKVKLKMRSQEGADKKMREKWSKIKATLTEGMTEEQKTKLFENGALRTYSFTY